MLERRVCRQQSRCWLGDNAQIDTHKHTDTRENIINLLTYASRGFDKHIEIKS